MKSRLNLTIENSLLVDVKSYAVKNKRSVSDLVEKLEKPTMNDNADLKDLYYKENAKKNGF
jgi:hypothetical protein